LLGRDTILKSERNYKMSSDIKITRLPNNINPDILVGKVMREKYAVCPYCGNKDYVNRGLVLEEEKKKGVISTEKEGWYGYPDGKLGVDWNGLIYIIKHRKELTNWEKYVYHCYKCGCSWESKSFPDEVLTEKEISEIGSGLSRLKKD
jgi:DNA-directed RNA polymerase subunit RPC12/RpoP